jgi:ABC-2 type transport system ATP-binding protein
VRDLSFAVPPGAIVALLGGNGAGKTTTLRMLAGILTPTAGTIAFANQVVPADSADWRARVGVLAEMPGLYPRMTAPAYLRFFGQLYRLDAARLRRRIAAVLETFDLTAFAARPLATYSRGMTQRLMLARATLHEPEVLLLDEPTSSLDPVHARAVHEMLRDARARGTTILLCSHNLAEVETLVDEVVFLRAGAAVAVGAPSAIKRAVLPALQFGLAVHPDDEAAASTILATLPSVTSVVGPAGGWLHFALASDQVGPGNEALVAALVRSGVRVRELREEHALSDAYFELYEGQVER